LDVEDRNGVAGTFDDVRGGDGDADRVVDVEGSDDRLPIVLDVGDCDGFAGTFDGVRGGDGDPDRVGDDLAGSISDVLKGAISFNVEGGNEVIRPVDCDGGFCREVDLITKSC